MDAEFHLNGRVVDAGSDEGCLQIGAMEDEIGRAIAGGEMRAQRKCREFSAGARRKDADGVGINGRLAERIAEAEIDEDARRVRRQLDAGPDLAQCLRPFEHGDIDAGAGECQSGGQSADARSDDDDMARLVYCHGTNQSIK